jgi:hypothetical protein
VSQSPVALLTPSCGMLSAMRERSRPMKSKVIASHTSSQRDSWWYLIQKDDGTLHVRHESNTQGKRTIDREVTLNDFMSERSGTQAELQNLIDRMFGGV